MLGSSLESRRIIERASGYDGPDLLLHLDDPVPARAVSFADAMVERRVRGEPLQYVLGRWAFRQLDLLVDRRVLIPRPETELLVELALELPRGARVHDVGTGSGAVALALAHERRDLRVSASDASEEALAVARRNVARHGVEHRIALEQGDLWEPVAALAKGCPFALILSNPPYIPTQNIADMGRHVAEHEPHLALDGGADGLDPHRRILDAAADYLAPGGRLFLEHEWYHGAAARVLAERRPGHYEDVRTLPDANGKDRALHARRGVESAVVG